MPKGGKVTRRATQRKGGKGSPTRTIIEEEEDVPHEGLLEEHEHIARVTVGCSWTQSYDYESVSCTATVELPVVLDVTPFRADAPFDSLPIRKAMRKAQSLAEKHMKKAAEELAEELLDG